MPLMINPPPSGSGIIFCRCALQIVVELLIAPPIQLRPFQAILRYDHAPEQVEDMKTQIQEMICAGDFPRQLPPFFGKPFDSHGTFGG